MVRTINGLYQNIYRSRLKHRYGGLIMRQVIRDFKTIMADRRERKEFIGSFACVMVVLVMLYVVLVIFH